MSSELHGFSIGIQRDGDKCFISLKAFGTLTHEDYESITPVIDGTLAQIEHPKIYALFDGTELDGWELRAA